MANGLKGNSIAYNNTSGVAKVMTLEQACKFAVWAKDAAIEVWTESQELAGTINGQATHKQSYDSDTPFSGDAMSSQLGSDFFEPIKIEIPNGVKVHGWVWGQSATWTIDDV